MPKARENYNETKTPQEENKTPRKSCSSTDDREVSRYSIDGGCSSRSTSGSDILHYASDQQSFTCLCNSRRDFGVSDTRPKKNRDSNSTNIRTSQSFVWKLDLSPESNPAGNDGSDGELIFNLIQMYGLGTEYLISKEFRLPAIVGWDLASIVAKAYDNLVEISHSLTIIPTRQVVKLFSNRPTQI